MFTAPDTHTLTPLILHIMSIQAVNKAVKHLINSYDQERERERGGGNNNDDGDDNIYL